MKQNTFKESFPSFPNYNQEMWEGHIPAGEGHQHINGDYCDRWVAKWGGGESYHGEIIHAAFSINAKTTVYIVGDSLWICEQRYAGKTDIWEYSNNSVLKFPTGLLAASRRHQLEDEKIEKILHMDFNCEFWKMVQRKALHLYEKG